jgi:hypothetical protein
MDLGCNIGLVVGERAVGARRGHDHLRRRFVVAPWHSPARGAPPSTRGSDRTGAEVQQGGQSPHQSGRGGTVGPKQPGEAQSRTRAEAR